ncbi:NF-X1-type zinc finger protein NFXL2 isoform X2 [Macadamia integrifolia]|uniref:NF-X1-type zinc finger protein NFXL2 isoform X2 n=1 Tax=Macadamia integrifolia TaxID=60698 RepID=UPI001C5326CD|nr:NF-X1-type zinc finger protein NFXL2 isoform X2 [Macadamia integrifolia]
MASTTKQRRLPESPSLDSDTDSDKSVTGADEIHHTDLSDSIFKSYLQITGRSSPDLSKIQAFLTSSRSGALSCLICLERIKLSHPTWSCSSGCSAVFHLVCIQSWARQASDLAAERALTRLSREHFPVAAANAFESSVWNCPKCRVEYTKSQIPKTYFCFCGKLENPPSDPWILPHSCGEVCGRPLKYNCGHECLLLCHPGPCPSCPKLVKSRCFCRAVEDVRRCGFKNFSCSGVCSKFLDCGIHRCFEVCHEGSCPPCRARGIYRCRCEKTEEERECFERKFRCGNPCERLLGCGKHFCGEGCHSGPCGVCPLQGKRTCPCGKKFYEGMACDVAAPTCGSTCGKMLGCGLHRCPERCHRGPCLETCRTVVMKSCRCGSLKKEVPCYQDLACERKCQRVRDCGRHACRRRCCDGDCPPCSEVCSRKLRCNNHKCPSPCHRGACAPCPIMVTISCFCGETHFEVPCGTEVEQKPPRCPKPCSISPLCRHRSNCKPHKCHYGACPPCRLLCEEEYPCGHNCKLRCHGPKPAPNPEFTLKPKKKKPNQPTGSSPGSSCPPCPELVWRPCLGQHIGEEKMMVCSDRKAFACQNLCGNLLHCGNHYCTKPCHALKGQSILGLRERSESCEECNLPCQKERKPACPHPCPLPCHVGDCSPCKALIKRSCHCGSMVHVFECTYYNSLREKEQMNVRSCGGPCHRKLQNCTHLCPETCHPGQCPSPEKCCKKVTVRCACQTLKKEWLCEDLQAVYRKKGLDPSDIPKSRFGLGLLPCNSECTSKLKAIEPELQIRKTRVSEVKEVNTENHVPKRRKKRERMQESREISKLQAIGAIVWKCLVFISIIICIIGASYCGYKGLLWLSDWMNEVEEQRQRKRFPRM